MQLNLEELVKAFAEVSALAGIHLDAEELRTELLPAPHARPSSLPIGTQAVYAFICGQGCLKVGKAGPKTQARFTSQHYGSNAPSTLAKSIIRGRSRMLALVTPAARAEFETLDISSVGGWLERNTSRFHLFLPASAPGYALTLAEGFVQCRFRPIYEGKGS